MRLPGVEAFYVQLDEGTFQPTQHCEGPWDPEACHGGPPSALALHEILRHDGESGLVVAQLHIDLLGPVPLSPIDFTTRTLREGRRIQLVETSGTASGRPVVNVRAWKMAVGAEGVPEIGTSATIPGPTTGTPGGAISSFPYGAAIDWSFLEGSFGEAGPSTVWATPRIPLVEEETIAPIEAAVLVADSANGISSVLPFDRYLFIPPAISTTLMRYPKEPTVAISARTQVSADGIGITRATLLDADGPFAYMQQALYVAPRP